MRASTMRGLLARHTNRRRFSTALTGRKRFWKEVSVGHVDDNEGRFEILLDGRAMKTPARFPLQIPSEALAHAAAVEWDAQGGPGGIQPSAMPLYTLCATAADNEHEDKKEKIRGEVLAYLRTDTVCYMEDQVCTV